MSPGAFARSRFARRPERRKVRRAFPLERRRMPGDRRQGSVDRLMLFRGADPEAVAEAIGACEVIAVPAGAALLQPGESNDAVYLLLSGRLCVVLDSTQGQGQSIDIEPGECIGELSAIDGKPASALVVAQSDARVLVLSQELLWSRLIPIPAFGRNLLASLAQRMRRSNAAMLEAQRRRLSLEHLRRELDVARSLQAGMLPLRRPLFPGRSDVEVAGLMEPASSVGGDLFDVFFVDDATLFLCVGDVSGHGVPAALFMARAIGLMRIAAMGTTQPDRLLERINEELCAGNDSSMFMTIFCGFFDVTTGRLTYSNAGHCAPVLVRSDGVRQIALPKGTAAGAAPGLRYEARALELARGDVLLCFTDGVTEAQDAASDAYSEARLLAAVARNAQAPVEALLDAIRGEVRAFTGRDALEDDCTLLALRRPSGRPQAMR